MADRERELTIEEYWSDVGNCPRCGRLMSIFAASVRGRAVCLRCAEEDFIVHLFQPA